MAWTPAAPAFFEGNDLQQQQQQLQEADVLQSKRKISFEKSLLEMKHIPMAPKSCNISLELTANWISPQELIVDVTSDVKGVPAEGSNAVTVRWKITEVEKPEGGSSSQIELFYYQEWFKSPWIKSMIAKESLKGTQKDTETKIIPKVTHNVKLYLAQKSKGETKQEVIIKRKRSQQFYFEERKNQIAQEIGSDADYTLVCKQAFPNTSVFDYYKLVLSKSDFQSPKTQKVYSCFNEFFSLEKQTNVSNLQYSNSSNPATPPQYFQERSDPSSILEYPHFQSNSKSFDVKMDVNIPFMPKSNTINEEQKVYFVSPHEIIICQHRSMKGRDEFYTLGRNSIVQQGKDVLMEFKYKNIFVKSTMLRSIIESKQREKIFEQYNQLLIPQIKELLPHYTQTYQLKYPETNGVSAQLAEQSNLDQQQLQQQSCSHTNGNICELPHHKQVEQLLKQNQNTQREALIQTLSPNLQTKEQTNSAAVMAQKMAKKIIKIIIIWFILYHILNYVGYYL